MEREFLAWLEGRLAEAESEFTSKDRTIESVLFWGDGWRPIFDDLQVRIRKLRELDGIAEQIRGFKSDIASALVQSYYVQLSILNERLRGLSDETRVFQQALGAQLGSASHRACVNYLDELNRPATKAIVLCFGGNPSMSPLEVVAASAILSNRVLITFPWSHRENPLFYPLLAHEIGHLVEESQRSVAGALPSCLEDAIADLRHKAEASLGGSKEAAVRRYRIFGDFWRNWIRELTCDYFAARKCGLGYAAALRFFSGNEPPYELMLTHPPMAARVATIRAGLQSHTDDATSGLLEEWENRIAHYRLRSDFGAFFRPEWTPEIAKFCKRATQAAFVGQGNAATLGRSRAISDAWRSVFVGGGRDMERARQEAQAACEALDRILAGKIDAPG